MSHIRILIGPDYNGYPMLKRVQPKGQQADPLLISVEQSDSNFDEEGESIVTPTRITWKLEDGFKSYRFGTKDSVAGAFITIASLKKDAPPVRAYSGPIPPRNGELVWREAEKGQLSGTKVGIEVWNLHTVPHDVPWKYTLRFFHVDSGEAFELDPTITNRR